MQNEIADAARDTKNKPRKNMAKFSKVLFKPEFKNKKIFSLAKGDKVGKRNQKKKSICV